ncbi:uncharacterized protein LOC126799895 [Argentina anserina]|uniref:uncharacterized protein LOC126799895 n=1 Tax=Argentina anserina TaxID=57926 RepID=UPI0021766F18|nr:uncharacterized protein LOC126799895 [Potentilla anserina]
MASKVGRLFQDQNLSVHSNGDSAVRKGGVKMQKKVGFGGRKPLGDVSNTGKPDLTKVSKKPVLSHVPEIIADASNKRGLSRAQTRGRKALSDVSNTFKPVAHKKSSIVAQPPPCGFEEEGFLHDHQQCIKSMRNANLMDQVDILMMMQGSDSSMKLLSPCEASQLRKVEPESPMRYLELKEMSELSIKQDPASPHCKTPLSPNHTKSTWIWDDCDFQVMETPQFLRH